MIQQQQQVKECLYNRWETSKAQVMKNMMIKYLKKFDKFKNVEDDIAKSKEFTFIKKSLSGLILSQSTPVISQKEIFYQIDENQKKKIIEIDQIKNSVMKPALEGLNMIKKGQENIIEQQQRMNKSYDKLTKTVFPDWKDIDSFDELTWLSSQKPIIIEN